MTEHNVENLRREVETFDDGHQSVCCYDAADRLVRVETRDADNALKIAIDYHYDEAGNNILRRVRDSSGKVLREIRFDANGEEIAEPSAGPVRWKSLDGTEEGCAMEGEEDISGVPIPPQTDRQSQD